MARNNNNSLLFISLSLLVLGLLSGLCCGENKRVVGIYELRRGEFSVKVSSWGATILSVILPDNKGKLDDVVLGYDRIGSYVNETTYFGALVGRVANRIGGARFTLGGKTYHLYPNDGKNSLHGGHRGFNQVIWDVRERVEGEFPYITFHYHSFDGEQGFPGDLDVFVTYKIDEDYTFSVMMRAEPRNKPTPINLAQHSYWNLGGHASGTILKNLVQIFGSHITPVDRNLIPTGEIAPVEGTPYDFREPRTVGSGIDNVPGGYDINYVLDGPADGQGVKKVAVVEEPRSGRVLELWSNQPGVQFYTANFIHHVLGKEGHYYEQHSALCLETQDFPDAIHHPNFPNEVYGPNDVYKHYMLYKFSIKK
ncbi:aldose 1-epimerase-like [Ananas comosus]|uniref:Aldose 1-epimerase n=1 Tax=Ananas comosus TaxID=4615 RepID=A0A6P5GBD2_ANACO|nr:aldose 1-epimerase-like [Ananas comosus]